MTQPTAEQKITNWARDFIQMNQSREGYCKMGEFKKVFESFKRSYGYEGSANDILEKLKGNGFLKFTKQRITWTMPFQSKY